MGAQTERRDKKRVMQEEEALTKLQGAWNSSEQKDECIVCLDDVDRAYWMGTEVGLLGDMDSRE